MKTTKPLSILKHCSLIGARLDRADLSHKNLAGVNFSDASLRGADFSFADLRGAQFVKADLSRACLYMADCTGADFSAADMTMSYGKGTLFTDAVMWYASLRRVTYKECFFIKTDMRGVDFAGGFLVGSTFNGANYEYARNLTGPHAPITRWWLNPKGGPPSYVPKDGYIEMMRSATGTISFQENAGARRKFGGSA